MGPRFDVVTIFPEMIAGALAYGVVARALASGRARVECWNPRDWSEDPHRSVDDRPYGGGPGMVMKFAPLAAAVRAAQAARGDAAPVVYLSPQGERFDDARARSLAAGAGAVLVCGRYEGVDERFVEACVDAELSIGDYVLSGGEAAALAVMDAVIRLVPGVLGDEDSASEDSFVTGLLDCPHYTRPEEIENRRVPEVLLSGDHAAIRRWRREESQRRTRERRADLVQSAGEPDFS
ncbi:MAG TPA: tRNA (guanosine(37)-N1)-methyltransferase TrmD [Gammaproteobacteria bacterium]|nr:tRNA (guanosine(37)-N1)-methyltransferase TrmD [Gammaproteobacteria bacterium]